MFPEQIIMCRFSLVFLGGVVFYAHLFSSAAEPIFHFSPSVSELEGFVETQTFPGPPNYESILSGDAIERGWYLRLLQPMTVISNDPKTDLGWKTEKNVKIIQIAMIPTDPSDWKKLSNGKRIKITGKLFNRQTGHHHARVVMEVQHVVALP